MSAVSAVAPAGMVRGLPDGLASGSARRAASSASASASAASTRRRFDARALHAVGAVRGRARRAVRAAAAGPGDSGDSGGFDISGLLTGGAPPTEEARVTERRLGRAAMLGFFFTTLGEVVTRGEGPLEQLRLEKSYVLNHINPVALVKDALELAGFYVESVFIVWVCLAACFLLAVQQGLASPVRTYSSRKDAVSKARGAARVDVMIDSVKEALNDVVTEQEPYERFNGRLAMVGFAFAVVGDTVTGGSGPLEQLNGETGIPVIDAELFGAFFLLGVLFNVVATGVTVGTRAWQKGKSVS